MLFSLLYFLVGRFLGTGRRSREQRDIELLVLRHQVRVLQHQVKRPRLRRLDRLLLAAASRAMPRGLWSSFVVRPETLLRWHRELVRRKLKLDLRVSATTVRTTLLRHGLDPARPGSGSPKDRPHVVRVHRGAAHRDPVPAARPGREVLRTVRRGVRGPRASG